MRRLGWKPGKEKNNKEKCGENDEENDEGDYLIKTMSNRTITGKSTKGKSSSSRETVKERVRNFRVFDIETRQMNYKALVHHPIHSGVMVDWSLFVDNGLERGFFDSINTDLFSDPQ
uniref:Uncharacterized protein n=1 Tax=Tanacetum cinerariifolium TaxID=118510 RepID=A0A6L2LK02_TANCI|nr:hypothetical protein [Tanacetum cinerariifolium]